MRLSADTIAGLAWPEGSAETFIWDEDIAGFGLRQRAQRKASRWIFQYRNGRKQRRITIGSFTALTATQARKVAADLHAKTHLGQDPAGEKIEGRVRAAETVGAVLETYLPHKREALGARSYVEVERHLLKHCQPLHALPVAKLDRRSIASRKAAIAAQERERDGKSCSRQPIGVPFLVHAGRPNRHEPGIGSDTLRGEIPRSCPWQRGASSNMGRDVWSR